MTEEERYQSMKNMISSQALAQLNSLASQGVMNQSALNQQVQNAYAQMHAQQYQSNMQAATAGPFDPKKTERYKIDGEPLIDDLE
jgi:hypothetical protein